MKIVVDKTINSHKNRFWFQHIYYIEYDTPSIYYRKESNLHGLTYSIKSSRYGYHYHDINKGFWLKNKKYL